MGCPWSDISKSDIVTQNFSDNSNVHPLARLPGIQLAVAFVTGKRG